MLTTKMIHISRWSWNLRYTMAGKWNCKIKPKLSILSWGKGTWASDWTISEMFSFRMNLLRGKWK